MEKSYGYPDISKGGDHNLMKFATAADAHDWAEGLVAFERYNGMMKKIGDRYEFSVERTTAAFVALSPNNDYVGNLRSLVTLLEGINAERPLERINTSTYRHCLKRAWLYAMGKEEFLEVVKGPKIRAFYKTIIDPLNNRHDVTVDGHMVCAWMNQDLPMKKALLRGPKAYETIADGVRGLANIFKVLPHQIQSVIWFARKRLARSRYTPQLDLLDYNDQNVWRVLVPIDGIQPFGDRPESGDKGRRRT